MDRSENRNVRKFGVAMGAAVGSVLLLGTSPSRAQQSPASLPAPPALTVTTQLVTLDATVNDKAGHPVLDLDKDEFRVTENGLPERIRYFASPAAHRMPPGDVVRSSADLQKIGDAPVTILVLDEINTPFVDMALARSALERYLKSQPELLTEPTALFFVNNTKLDVIHDYTQNRTELEQSLKRHFPDYPWQLTVNQGDMGLVPRMTHSLTALVQISEASRGVRGRKNLIWVGKGFPSIDVHETDPDSLTLITDAIKRTTFVLLQSKVSVFTIDPEAIDPTPVIDQESDSGMSAGDLNGTGLVFAGAIQFNSFASSTGGHAFAMNNFIDQEIASSISDGNYYYELSYTPVGNSQDPAKYRKIAVAVTRPGLTVITRAGYFPSEGALAPLPQEQQADVVGEVQFDLSTAAMSKLVYNGLQVSAKRSSLNGFSVSIDAKGIAWKENGNGHVAELSIMAVCFSPKDKPLFKTSSEHTASTAGDISKLAGSVTYKLPVSVPAGTSRIRFVVRDLNSGKVGSFDFPVP